MTEWISNENQMNIYIKVMNDDSFLLMTTKIG